jgi:KDO2-lipid IV(A) lauroyltransferase
VRRDFLKPRYWPALVVFTCLRVCGQLPYAMRVALGRGLGRALHRLLRRRRHIAHVNLRLCFPETTPDERNRLVREHFAAFGVAVLEMGTVWWAPPERLSPLARFVGLEHLARALKHGRGAILLSGHFASMEMGVAHFARLVKTNVVYRPHGDPLIDEMIRDGRTRYPGQMVKRNDFRAMAKALRRNEPVWFPPDQDFGRRHSVYAPLFGRPAATVNATARLARLSGAPVLPFLTQRLPGGAGYVVTIGPELEDFPSGDELRDARQVNRVIEDAIRRDVPQYLWVHRRFKTRPAGAADPYAR